ncbi:hypothetical protein NMD14_06625 [Aeromonas veronii]
MGRIKQEANVDQETIVSLFACQYPAGEQLLRRERLVTLLLDEPMPANVSERNACSVLGVAPDSD